MNFNRHLRKEDQQGRILIQIELRMTLSIATKHSLEIFIAEDTIILRKIQSIILLGSSQFLLVFLISLRNCVLLFS